MAAWLIGINLMGQNGFSGRPDEDAAEAMADAAFWHEQDPWLAATILVSCFSREAGAEALSRARRGEERGQPAAADFWLAVYGCIRNLG